MWRIVSTIGDWLFQPLVAKVSVAVTVPHPLPAAAIPVEASSQETSTMNLASILALIQALPSLLGVVDAVVNNTEQVMGGLPGSQKLAAATAKVNSVLSVATQDAQTLSAVSNVVPTLVNASVAAFNAGGVFKNASANGAAAAAAAPAGATQ